jgi:hypothetical protein
MNLVAAIRLFPARAAHMTFLEEGDIFDPVKKVVKFHFLAKF